MLRHRNLLAALLLVPVLLFAACTPQDPVDPSPDESTQPGVTTVSPGEQTIVPPPDTVAPPDTVPPVPDTTPAPTTTAPIPAETTAPPVAGPDAKGSFSSDTGSNLDAHLDWSVLAINGNTVTIRAEAYITCYSISVSARQGGVLKIGNASQNFSTEAILYDQNVKHTVPLATAIVDVPLSTSGATAIDVSVSWPFIGTYSGVKIDRLTCEGTITLGTAAPETTAPPETTRAPETTAAPEPPEQPDITTQGQPLIYRAALFTDRPATHFATVTLVRSTAERDRLLAAHPADCTDTVCQTIRAALEGCGEDFFAEKLLLLVPQGSLYPAAVPVETFDVRADDGAVFVHIRDVAESRNAAQLSAPRFHLQIAELPADTVTGRSICLVQHAAYYTDSGKYEYDYLRDEGISVSPTVRAYLPDAITP